MRPVPGKNDFQAVNNRQSDLISFFILQLYLRKAAWCYFAVPIDCGLRDPVIFSESFYYKLLSSISAICDFFTRFLILSERVKKAGISGYLSNPLFENIRIALKRIFCQSISFHR